MSAGSLLRCGWLGRNFGLVPSLVGLDLSLVRRFWVIFGDVAGDNLGLLGERNDQDFCCGFGLGMAESWVVDTIWHRIVGLPGIRIFGREIGTGYCFTIKNQDSSGKYKDTMVFLCHSDLAMTTLQWKKCSILRPSSTP